MQKTPWHIWVVGAVALFWNAGGAWNYTATKLRLAPVMEQMTPEQLAFVDAIPAWATAAWALAVWGGVLGAVLILMRRALAFHVLLISFLAMVLTTIQNFVLSPVSMADIMPPGAAVFSLIIFVFAAFLVVYTRAQTKAGRLT